MNENPRDPNRTRKDLPAESIQLRRYLAAPENWIGIVRMYQAGLSLRSMTRVALAAMAKDRMERGTLSHNTLARAIAEIAEEQKDTRVLPQFRPGQTRVATQSPTDVGTARPSGSFTSTDLASKEAGLPPPPACLWCGGEMHSREVRVFGRTPDLSGHKCRVWVCACQGVLWGGQPTWLCWRCSGLCQTQKKGGGWRCLDPLCAGQRDTAGTPIVTGS